MNFSLLHRGPSSFYKVDLVMNNKAAPLKTASLNATRMRNYQHNRRKLYCFSVFFLSNFVIDRSILVVRVLCGIVNRVPGKVLTRKCFREAKRNSISSTRDVRRSPLHLETIKVNFYDCLNLLSLIIVWANHTL